MGSPLAKVFSCLGIGILLLVAVGCGSRGTTPLVSSSSTDPTVGTKGASAHVTVAIRGYAFEPSNVRVESGATITFVNDDVVAHTATAPDGSFDTGTIKPGNSATVHVPADASGTIGYVCEIHQFMQGTLEVR